MTFVKNFPFFLSKSTGNRWKGVASPQLRHDDEVYGPEARPGAENLQFSEPRRTAKALKIFIQFPDPANISAIYLEIGRMQEISCVPLLSIHI